MHDDDLLVQALLSLGRERLLDVSAHGPLFAAARDWLHAGEDLGDDRTILRFCDAHDCTPEDVARLVAWATAQ